MFNFLKKTKSQHVYEIPEPQQELKLSVRQRALNVFSNIEGLDDIKEMMLRALESPERVHTLLVVDNTHSSTTRAASCLFL